MSLRMTLTGATANFAHLAGLRRPVTARAEDQGEQDTNDNDREDLARRLGEAEERARQAEQRADEADEELARLRAENERDPDGDGDDDTNEEGDTDSDREEMRRPAGDRIRAARARERARCAAIFADAAAGANPRLAAQLAFGADPLPREAAIGLLRAGGPGRTRLADRMAANPQMPIGGESPPARQETPEAAAAAAVALYDRHRKVKR